MAFQKSVCIEPMYGELPFLERFQAAKEDGFDFVEFWSWTDKDLDAVKAAAEKALGLVGLPKVGECFPAQLSIGEARRVELARALISSPPVLLLDELTANLDDDTIWDIMHLLNELNSRGTTIIMATHASQYVNIMRRRVITLVDGRLFGDVKNGKYGDIV